MRRHTSYLIGLVLLLGFHFLQAEDRRTDKNILVLMTFNVEFLWDGVDPEEGNPAVTFPWKGSKSEAEEHMEKIAQIIIRSNPDILNFCEVENEDALKVLNDKFLSGRGYKGSRVQIPPFRQ